MQAREVGKPISQGRDEVSACVYRVQWFIDNLHLATAPINAPKPAGPDFERDNYTIECAPGYANERTNEQTDTALDRKLAQKTGRTCQLTLCALCTHCPPGVSTWCAAPGTTRPAS
jgi:hypothetical protein